MDYNDVPLFVHVVESGGFTAAARALGREKSAVSRSVSRLEDELGVRLLQRTTRKLALTDAGQAFYDRVRGAVAGVDEAASAVRELGTEPRGLVRVTAPGDSWAFGVPESIARFVAKYPGIHVELMLTARTVDLVADGIDLAIRAGKLTDSTLIARRVGSTELRLFAAPAYLRRRGHPQTLLELAQHDCVLYRPRTPGKTSWTLTGAEGDETVEVKGPIGADEMSFIAQTIAAGVGIGQLPVEVALPFAERKEIELVLPEYRVTGSSLYLVMPSATFVPARVILLRDFLFKELEHRIAASNKVCALHGHASKN
jgi:DNA-binding transcriptional LysR family regulator